MAIIKTNLQFVHINTYNYIEIYCKCKYTKSRKFWIVRCMVIKKYEDLLMGLIVSLVLMSLNNDIVIGSISVTRELLTQDLSSVLFKISTFMIRSMGVLSFIGVILTIYFAIRILLKLMLLGKGIGKEWKKH